MLSDENLEYFEVLLDNLSINEDLGIWLLKIEGFINFATFFANFSTLTILPDKNGDYFGDWQSKYLKSKGVKRYNMYFTDREKEIDGSERIRGFVIDRSGKSFFNGKSGKYNIW